MVSINTALKALIENRLANNNFEKYPFSSALLLYTLVTHDNQSINLDKIVDWSHAYLVEKAENKKFNKNKDKEIAAVFLIYYVLNSAKLKTFQQTTHDTLINLYKENYTKKKLFFGSFELSSVIQFSADIIKKDLPEYDENTVNILDQYLAEEPFNASLASVFLMLLTNEKRLFDKIQSHFPSVTKYEDKTNYQYAMWRYDMESISEDAFKKVDESVSAFEPPLLADLYNGGDITNFHQSKFEQANAKLSPLYVSILYCLQTELEENRKTIAEKHIDNKYKNGIFNRIGGLLVGIIATAIGIYAIWISVSTYLSMKIAFNPIIIVFLIGTAIIYPLAFTLLFDLSLKGKPDKRIFSIIGERFKNQWTNKFFVGVILITVALAIIVNKISEWPLL